jgi:hypothetical protein
MIPFEKDIIKKIPIVNIVVDVVVLVHAVQSMSFKGCGRTATSQLDANVAAR